MPRTRRKRPGKQKIWNSALPSNKKYGSSTPGCSSSQPTDPVSTASANGTTHTTPCDASCKSQDTTKEMTLKERIKKTQCNSFKMKEGLYIGNLRMDVLHKDKDRKVQKLALGKENQRNNKVILLVGATGTGKTTLINAMTNYIFSVEFDDDFRFTIIDAKEDPNRSDASSQTDYITAFQFNNMTGMPFDYNYVLIDTPGFGDTRGIERDRDMMHQIESFFKQDYGIDQIDGVGFVIPASVTRLTQTQKYVLDGLASMFGKDIKKNIFILTTFSDARKPPVLKALKESGLEYGEMYKFNNSALYARRKVESYKNSDDSESDNEEAVSMSRQYWEMAVKSMDKFFAKLGQMSPVSLTLTKEVLEERRNLQTVVCSLQAQIQLGLEKLSVLNQEKQLLAQIGDDVKGCADHYMDIEVPKIEERHLKPNECTTNCLKCSFTCHFPCYLPQTQDKQHCAAMSNGVCYICPLNCGWDVHKHMNFRYETKYLKERRTVQQLLTRYNEAFFGKLTKERVIRNLENDINSYARELMEIIKDIQTHINRLEEIALKPNPLSTKEYIDLMVQSEKMQKKHNFEKRIMMLQKLKQEANILEAVKKVNENSPKTGEALLSLFQDLTTATSSDDDESHSPICDFD